MKPSHITTPRCLGEATFTVGYYSATFSHPRRSSARWVALAVIALVVTAFAIKGV